MGTFQEALLRLASGKDITVPLEPVSRTIRNRWQTWQLLYAGSNNVKMGSLVVECMG